MSKEPPRNVVHRRGGGEVRHAMTSGLAASIGQKDTGEFIEVAADLNAGEPWSDADLLDLKAALESGDSVSEAAQFLCRHTREVRAKMTELGLKVKIRARRRRSTPT